jgi:glycosyltransferase involved in cell wall biosynthesis
MKFDIILPTIGRDSLYRAVQSIIDQTYTNWTLYIIGDGVDTKHYPILDELYKHPWIECYSLIEQHASYGATARNFGISQGNSNWIAYIDDDDIWCSNHLETHATLVKENPGASMVRTAGQSFFIKHKSPRSSKLVRKMGPVNSTDILTVGMSHTRNIFNQTDGWQSCDNHDHLLWKEMKAAGGTSVESDIITFHFKR